MMMMMMSRVCRNLSIFVNENRTESVVTLASLYGMAEEARVLRVLRIMMMMMSRIESVVTLASMYG